MAKVEFTLDGYYKVYDKVSGDIDIAAWDKQTDSLMFCGSADEYKVADGRFVPVEFIMSNEGGE